MHMHMLRAESIAPGLGVRIKVCRRGSEPEDARALLGPRNEVEARHDRTVKVRAIGAGVVRLVHHEQREIGHAQARVHECFLKQRRCHHEQLALANGTPPRD